MPWKKLLWISWIFFLNQINNCLTPTLSHRRGRNTNTDMKINRRHREGAEVSTDSLSDIMFFLLIFFLILSTLVNPSVIKINLPSSKANQQIDTKPIALVVTKDLQYYLNNKPVDAMNLESELVAAMSQMKEPTVILKVDNSLTVQDLVNVMQIGAKLKVKMVLGTKPPNAG